MTTKSKTASHKLYDASVNITPVPQIYAGSDVGELAKREGISRQAAWYRLRKAAGHTHGGPKVAPQSPAAIAEIRELAHELREFRLNQDYTYQHMAGLTHISRSALQRIEHGDLNLGDRTIRKLKRFLEAARAA